MTAEVREEKMRRLKLKDGIKTERTKQRKMKRKNKQKKRKSRKI